MALLTLANLLDEVRDEIPNKEQAMVVRAANKVIRRLHTECVQPERTTFTTKAKVTTGTVSVTLNSASVTFSSSVLSASDPLYLVQIVGETTWFKLTRSTDTTGTLSSVWPTTTNAAATYTIVYPAVTLGSGVGEVTRVRRYGDSDLRFSVAGGCPISAGVPEEWSPYSHDSATASPNDDLLRIFLNPAPQDRIVYEVWYRPRTAFLDAGGATTQLIPFPNLWYEAIVRGTLFHLWMQESAKDKVALAAPLYEAALARARGAAMPGAVIMPRRNGRGVFAYEERPIG